MANQFFDITAVGNNDGPRPCNSETTGRLAENGANLLGSVEQEDRHFFESEPKLLTQVLLGGAYTFEQRRKVPTTFQCRSVMEDNAGALVSKEMASPRDEPQLPALAPPQCK